MSKEVSAAPIAIEQQQLDDLHQRLANTRWPEKEPVSDWSQGIPLSYVRELCHYWQHDYDWRRWEARLNGFDPARTEIDGVDIHF
ncbi:MAG: epoxide hydrolase N-terminal domain-containing protein, partial [Pseudomonadales bacterium]